MFAQLRNVLAEANYTETGVAAALGRTSDAGFQSPEVPLLERRLLDCDNPQLASLITLFTLGSVLSFDQAAQALKPFTPEDFPELLERREGGVKARLKLTPYEGFVFA